MKIPAVNPTWYREYYINHKKETSTSSDYKNDGVVLSMPYYLPLNLSFGLANSKEIKKLISYGMPCIYTEIETINPELVQRHLKSKVYNKPLSIVMKYLSRFEWNMNSSKEADKYIEKSVYYLIKAEAKKYPNKTLKELFQILAPKYKDELYLAQEPIFKTLRAYIYSLPSEFQGRLKNLLNETDDKISDKPVKIPFSVDEFRYKLDKIKQDIGKLHDKNALGVVNKLIKDSRNFGFITTPKNIYQQQKILTSMETYVKHSILRGHEPLNELFNVSKSRLNQEKTLVPFSRKVFISDLKDVLKDLKDEELKNTFIRIAEKLPTSRDNIAAYIVKFSKEPSEKIAYRLLWPFFGTVEHIHERSNGGPDILSNYAVATARANSDRSNLPFLEQISQVPNTERGAQKQIDRLLLYYKNGIFAKEGIPVKYISDFKETIAIQSEGAIILDTSTIEQGRFCFARPALMELNFNKQELRVFKS